MEYIAAKLTFEQFWGFTSIGNNIGVLKVSAGNLGLIFAFHIAFDQQWLFAAASLAFEQFRGFPK